MVAEVLSGMVHGITGEIITVQTDISEGLPMFNVIGYLSAEVKEAKERVRTALKNSGFRLPPKRIAANLAPADIRKSGTNFDLAIAVGLLAAMGLIAGERVKGILFLGELALDGTLFPVTGSPGHMESFKSLLQQRLRSMIQNAIAFHLFLSHSPIELYFGFLIPHTLYLPYPLYPLSYLL